MTKNAMHWTKEEEEILRVAAQEHPEDPKACLEAYLTLGGRPRTYRALGDRLGRVVLNGAYAGLPNKLIEMANEVVPGAPVRAGSKLARKVAMEARREARKLTRETAPPPSVLPKEPGQHLVGKPLDEKIIRWAVDGYTLGIISSEEMITFLNRRK